MEERYGSFGLSHSRSLNMRRSRFEILSFSSLVIGSRISAPLRSIRPSLYAFVFLGIVVIDFRKTKTRILSIFLSCIDRLIFLPLFFKFLRDIAASLSIPLASKPLASILALLTRRRKPFCPEGSSNDSKNLCQIIFSILLYL